MEESLFSSEPRSFRMARKSPEAARLRDAVSKKLSVFLENYSDEVLAEYIVVLVCNGKHQNQARDDLEAFLGEDSGTFVAWLWDYLSKEYISKVTPKFSIPEAEGTDNLGNNLDRKNTMLADHHAHSVRPPKSKNELIERPSCHTNQNHLKPPQGPHKFQHSQPSLDECSTEVDMESLQIQEIAICKSTGPSSGNCTETTKKLSSLVTCSNEVLSAGQQQPLQYELQNHKVEQIPKHNYGLVDSQHLPEQKTEQTAISLRSVIAEDHQQRPQVSRNSAETRLPSPAVDDSPHQTARPRGNVWDRLGRPSIEEERSIKETQYHHLDSETLDHQGEEHRNPRLARTSLAISSTSSLNRQSYAVDRGNSEDICVQLSDEHRTSDTLDSASNLKRRRQLGEFNSNYSASFCKENNNQDKEKYQNQHGRSLPVKQDFNQNMNKFARVADRSVASDAKFGAVNLASTGLDSKPTAISQSQSIKKSSATVHMENLVPFCTAFSANSKSQSQTEVGNAIQKPMQDEVLAVKLRLRQVEMDMLKLRSKQVGRSNDGKHNMSSVSQNHSDDDIESRTVLVENVHFASTREALISHFAKCGTIAKVIMLTDTVTALPKGASYIVFANKESADKAISLSGTSFFSRILKVIRKAEVPPDFLLPSQPTLKQLQQFYPQPYGKGSMQKQYTSFHLQWRRDQNASEENSLSTSSTGLRSSNSGE